jgi:hypothetical protein
MSKEEKLFEETTKIFSCTGINSKKHLLRQMLSIFF